MLYVNCAALPEGLAEDEFFGHVKGAFIGANSDRPGKFEVADGGTLFLDEIGELSLALQPKLLRALQDGEIQRVGTERSVRVDVRVLVATNRDLEREVEAGRFRQPVPPHQRLWPERAAPAGSSQGHRAPGWLLLRRGAPATGHRTGAPERRGDRQTGTVPLARQRA